jgi:hypothetical protein
MNKYTAVNIALAAGVIAVVALLSCEARAADTYVIAHAASVHGATSDNYKFNEVNPGAALRVDLTDTQGVQAGVYRNSYYKTTAYAVYQYTPLAIGPVRVGGFAGLASGYKAQSTLNVGALSVVGGAYAVADVGGYTVAVRAVPRISPKTVGVITVEVGFKF